MAKTLTNNVIRKEWARVQSSIENNPHVVVRGTSSGQDSTTSGDTVTTSSIVQKQITRAENNKYLITNEGVRVRLYNPIPCLFWRCTTAPDKDGISTLKTPVWALCMMTTKTDEENICLGIDGVTDEFEVVMQCGGNEIQINSTFINLAGEHVVKNGVEVE